LDPHQRARRLRHLRAIRLDHKPRRRQDGTSEIYSAVEGVEEVADSLVVDIQKPGGDSFMPLFVVLKEASSSTTTSRRR
jgi:hypothetical protein